MLKLSKKTTIFQIILLRYLFPLITVRKIDLPPFLNDLVKMEKLTDHMIIIYSAYYYESKLKKEPAYPIFLCYQPPPRTNTKYTKSNRITPMFQPPHNLQKVFININRLSDGSNHLTFDQLKNYIRQEVQIKDSELIKKYFFKHFTHKVIKLDE